jgi:hypothetical protein
VRSMSACAQGVVPSCRPRRPATRRTRHSLFTCCACTPLRDGAGPRLRRQLIDGGAAHPVQRMHAARTMQRQPVLQLHGAQHRLQPRPHNLAKIHRGSSCRCCRCCLPPECHLHGRGPRRIRSSCCRWRRRLWEADPAEQPRQTLDLCRHQLCSRTEPRNHSHLLPSCECRQHRPVLSASLHPHTRGQHSHVLVGSTPALDKREAHFAIQLRPTKRLRAPECLQFRQDLVCCSNATILAQCLSTAQSLECDGRVHTDGLAVYDGTGVYDAGVHSCARRVRTHTPSGAVALVERTP